MNDQIEERIKIIKGFKSYTYWKEKSPEEISNLLRVFAPIDYGFTLVFLLFVIVLSASALFELEFLSSKWEKSGLIVLMTISFSLRSPLTLAELMLKKHVQKIRTKNLAIKASLNFDLRSIISNFNNRRRKSVFFIIPVVLIMLASFAQVFEMNPYWSYFSSIILAYCVFVFVWIHYQLLKLRNNLKTVED